MKMIKMPKFQNTLDELLAEAVLASGVDRLAKLTQVREYLQKTTIDELRRQLAQITSIQELRMLQAAGVPASLQDTFLQIYLKYTSV